jgi:hypothetical protein
MKRGLIYCLALIILSTLFFIKPEITGNAVYDLKLEPGWNLVSIPLEQSDLSHFEYIIPLDQETMQLSQSKDWQGLIAKKSNSILSIVKALWDNPKEISKSLLKENIHSPGSVYWVYSKEGNSVKIRGEPSSVTDLTLDRGWNVIGVPQTTSNNLIQKNPLHPIAFGFDPKIQNFIEVPLSEIKPWQGYFVYSENGSKVYFHDPPISTLNGFNAIYTNSLLKIKSPSDNLISISKAKDTPSKLEYKNDWITVYEGERLFAVFDKYILTSDKTPILLSLPKFPKIDRETILSSYGGVTQRFYFNPIEQIKNQDGDFKIISRDPIHNLIMLEQNNYLENQKFENNLFGWGTYGENILVSNGILRIAGNNNQNPTITGVYQDLNLYGNQTLTIKYRFTSPPKYPLKVRICSTEDNCKKEINSISGFSTSWDYLKINFVPESTTKILISTSDGNEADLLVDEVILKNNPKNLGLKVEYKDGFIVQDTEKTEWINIDNSNCKICFFSNYEGRTRMIFYRAKELSYDEFQISSENEISGSIDLLPTFLVAGIDMQEEGILYFKNLNAKKVTLDGKVIEIMDSIHLNPGYRELIVERSQTLREIPSQ